MPLPEPLADVPDDTGLVGDIDAWMETYYESGQALQDYNERMALRYKELEDLM